MAELKSIYIVAVGGQGSIVLTDWLFNAAHIAGYVAHTVGLPGLSQRGGSTSFYLEVLLSHDPEEQQRAVFGHFPVPGAVDIILAQEFLELGRALQRGYGSASTAIIASTHRVYSLQEKMPASGGPARDEDLYRLAQQFSGQFIGFNAVELASQHGLGEVAVNAILLGALSASGLLSLKEESFVEAIRQTGIAVEDNLRAFRLGRDFVAQGKHQQPPPPPPKKERWERIQELSARLPAQRRQEFIILCTVDAADFPPPVQDVLIEAIFQLTDYQDSEYASRFLDAVTRIYSLDREDRGYELTRLFTTNLAALMTYEDMVQVARLKTRQERFSKIRAEAGIGRGQVYGVTDYLSPEAEEVLGLLPRRLFRLLKPWLLRSKQPAVLRFRFPTTLFPAFLFLRLLAGMRGLRRGSHRYRREQELWREYEAAVREFHQWDYALGCLVAGAGQMVKGYGAIRRHYVTAVRRFIAQVLRPVAEREAALNGEGYLLTLRVGSHARALILQDEAGIERAERLARWVLKQVEEESRYPATLEMLSAPVLPSPLPE